MTRRTSVRCGIIFVANSPTFSHITACLRPRLCLSLLHREAYRCREKELKATCISCRAVVTGCRCLRFPKNCSAVHADTCGLDVVMIKRPLRWSSTRPLVFSGLSYDVQSSEGSGFLCGISQERDEIVVQDHSPKLGRVTGESNHCCSLYGVNVNVLCVREA